MVKYTISFVVITNSIPVSTNAKTVEGLECSRSWLKETVRSLYDTVVLKYIDNIDKSETWTRMIVSRFLSSNLITEDERIELEEILNFFLSRDTCSIIAKEKSKRIKFLKSLRSSVIRRSEIMLFHSGYHEYVSPEVSIRVIYSANCTVFP